MAYFDYSELAPIVSYPLRNTQIGIASSKGIPSLSETPIADIYSIPSSTAQTDAFTAPSVEKPEIITTVIRAERSTNDKFVVTEIPE